MLVGALNLFELSLVTDGSAGPGDPRAAGDEKECVASIDPRVKADTMPAVQRLGPLPQYLALTKEWM